MHALHTKFNENPEVTEMLRKNRGLLKTLRQSATCVWDQVRISHCSQGIQDRRTGTKLDCMRKKFFQGHVKKDIHR
jgi:hypothetical protein